MPWWTYSFYNISNIQPQSKHQCIFTIIMSFLLTLSEVQILQRWTWVCAGLQSSSEAVGIDLRSSDFLQPASSCTTPVSKCIRNNYHDGRLILRRSHKHLHFPLHFAFLVVWYMIIDKQVRTCTLVENQANFLNYRQKNCWDWKCFFIYLYENFLHSSFSRQWLRHSTSLGTSFMVPPLLISWPL